MRPIDADEVKRFYEEEFPDLDNGVHWSRNDIICNLDNIPTVKALPAKMVADWFRKLARKLAEINGLDYDAIEKTLDNMEEEND